MRRSRAELKKERIVFIIKEVSMGTERHSTLRAEVEVKKAKTELKLALVGKIKREVMGAK